MVLPLLRESPYMGKRSFDWINTKYLWLNFRQKCAIQNISIYTGIMLYICVCVPMMQHIYGTILWQFSAFSHGHVRYLSEPITDK